MMPFKVGDMVVSRKLGAGIVEKVDRDYIRDIFDNSGLKRIYDYDYDSITAIRNPRPGGKEARDIVAMLGRNFKAHVFMLGYKPEGKGWYKAWVNHNMPHVLAFYKAKQMLEIVIK